MRKTTGVQPRLSRQDWIEYGLLAVLGLAVVGGLAAIAVQSGGPPVGPRSLALSPLSAPTPTATVTPGWWDRVTPGPLPMGGLPGIPTVALSAKAGAKVGEAVPFNAVNCPLANVRIEAITGSDRRGWWNIYGTAALPQLWYWKGEISADGKGWSMLYRSAAAVSGGLLIEFNTGTVPAGTYLVRLMAVDRTGNYPEPCTIQATISR
jgi:hypothetical protein